MDGGFQKILSPPTVCERFFLEGIIIFRGKTWGGVFFGRVWYS